MRKRLTIIALISVLASTAMISLYFFATSNSIKNGFARFFEDVSHSKSTIITIPDRQYFAGHTDSKLFLANYQDAKLLQVNLIDSHAIIHPATFNVDHSRKTKIQIDSPLYFLIYPGKNKAATGIIGDTSLTLLINNDFRLVDSAPINEHLICVKTFSEDGKEIVLGKKNRAGLQRYPEVLEKQIDGKFCTDGILTYNKKKNLLVYAYYYRNQVILFDTSCNQINRFRTIDTITHARISVAEIQSEQFVSLASPPRLVNRQMRSSGNFIIINSNVMADNETISEFNDNKVFDVYNIAGHYYFSFYIPLQEDQRLIDYLLVGNKFVILYETYLWVIDLTPQLIAWERE